MNCIKNKENPIEEIMEVIKTTQARQIKGALEPIELQDSADFISKNLGENEEKKAERNPKGKFKTQIKETESEVEWNRTAMSEMLDLLEKN